MNPEAGVTSLTPERWQQVEFIFHAVLEMPKPDRAEFLRRSCKGDIALLEELQNLLFAFEDEKLFRPPVADIGEAKGRLGEVVGGYKLEAELGQGGMGTVYLAHRADGEFEQQVALKVVSSHLRTRFFTERFRAERQILADLNHPNITRLLDGGVDITGDPYLVMEYVDGQALNRYCDERLLEVPERIRLFLQACSAVEYAHRKLVVHRDLKPGNVLVTKDGIPKLLDFGTAKLLLTELAESTSTRFGAMTPRYASPEQLRGEPVSTSMDVYALGVMLYELASGAWPFGDPSSPIAGLERAVRDVDPAPPRSLITEESARLRSTSVAKLARVLDGDLGNVIAKGIESDPRRRYTSVEQFSLDLRRYLAGQPVLAHDQTWLYRGARFVQRHRWRMVAGAVLGIALGLSALVTLQQYGRGQRRLVQVRDLSQSYLTDILREVQKLPGSMKACLLIVDRARKNLDQLAPEAPHDPELRRALATAYLQLADIQGKPFTVSIGDTAGALESYRKAETMAAQAAPGDWDMLAVLVQARVMTAVIETRSGQYAEAMSLLNSTLDPARRLWKDAPRDFQVNGRPAAALYAETNLRLGHTMLNAAVSEPDLRAALAQILRTVAIAEEIQAAHPGMPDVAGTASQYAGFALEGLGRWTGDSSYLKQSVAAHQRSADSACQAFEKDPGQQAQRRCGDALGELSWAMHQAGLGEPGVEAALRALAKMEPVAKAEPDSVEAQSDLADAYFHLGAAEITAGKFNEAIGHLRTAESRIRGLTRTAPNDALQTSKLYSDIQRELGVALLQTHKVGGAVVAFEASISAFHANSHQPDWKLRELQQQLAQARALQAATPAPR
jgi:serine/threonine protein kinase/tetratricopeptide (TPR) repeat protein